MMYQPKIGDTVLQFWHKHPDGSPITVLPEGKIVQVFGVGCVVEWQGGKREFFRDTRTLIKCR